MSTLAQPLTNLQLELLKLFSLKVDENDLIEIKKILSRYFAEKAMNEADKVWLEQGFSDIDSNKLAHQHLRATSM
jgi:hypothetical protein